ncbi:MAG: protein translocase subunit SecF [Pyrinomonadaceae bacterium]
MIQVFKDIRFDWLAKRRLFIGLSVLLMLAGLGSAIFRQWQHPNGTEAFDLGVDFKGGTVVTTKFNKPTTAEEIRATLAQQGVKDATIQGVTDKPDTFLIKLPLEGSIGGESTGEVEKGRKRVGQALNIFGQEGQAYEIIGTDAVGAVAGAELRNKAIAVTLAALVGMLVYIAFRFEWTYGAAAVIAVFHDVLVTLGFFSIFQWEISLTVIAALLTLVGASVNDTIVVFDRIRENRRLHRRESLYKITNDSINQTLSRTVITQGLIILSVLAMVIFGGEVLRAFSLALLIGTIVGTYSSIAVASPVMVWWEQRLERANKTSTPPSRESGISKSDRGLGANRKRERAVGTAALTSQARNIT